VKLKGNTRSILSQAGWAILGCMLLPLTSFGALFPVTQNSVPAGLVSQSAIIEGGQTYQSIDPQLNKNGYTFGYWAIDGVRQAGADGRSLTRVSGVIEADSNFTAHYYADNADTDGDGVKDWFEYRMFGDLSRSPNDDSDGDGFSNKRESELGQDALVVDFMEPGGIAGRMSNALTYADTSMLKVTIKSDPTGYINTSINYKEFNASITTQSLNGATNGSHFAYWTVNGVRKASPNGVASSKVGLNISGDTEIVAHYIPSSQDTDGDGVMDWFEYYQFGDLSAGPEDDSDGDGFSNKRESELGQEATIAEFTETGGIAGRMSNSFTYADTTMLKVTIRSNPTGFINTSTTYEEFNSTLSTQSLNGTTNGSNFAYWSINGVRQASPNGVARSKVSAVITGDTEFVAHYLPSTEDSDVDGVKDWFEKYQFGSLDLGPNDDPDSDGYSNKREGELGQEATIAEFTEAGGIAGRMSNSVVYYVQQNRPPTNLDLNNTIVFTNRETNSSVGILTPTDPDDPGLLRHYTYSFLNQLGGEDNQKYNLLNNHLRTSQVFTSEGNHTILVRVSDDEGAFLDKNFTIQAIHDPNKDDDNDGLTYAQEQALGTSDQNPDSDGDGFSDTVEVAYGSNPASASSVANATPYDLNATSPLTILENQSAGTIITEFNATDADINAYLSFSLVDGNGSSGNSFFDLDINGTLTSAVVFDYENNESNYSIRVRVADEHNASLEKTFRVSILNEVEDNDGDGMEDFYDSDDDNDGFSDVEEIAKGTDPFDVHSVPNALPSSLVLNNLRLFENLPAGSIIGEFNATDPDANSTLTITLFDENGSSDNTLFIIDENVSLRTTRIFDYEIDDWNYSIRVAVIDEHNLSIERTFTIPLLNIVEDLDSDGIEDFYDLDDDNDGFPDIYEVGYGSNPRDANSTANIIPDQLDLNGSVVEWNSTAGTRVGQFAVNDPDENASLSLRFVDTNDTDHDLFMIDENFTLITTRNIPYDRALPSLLINVKLSDEWNASLEKTFEIVVTAKPNIQDSNQTFDTNETIIDGNHSIIVDGNFSAWWGNERPDADGWVIDSAMGTFRPHENGWLYHLHLGWLYASPAEDDSLWVWSSEHRWLWTRKDVFPFVYRWEDANWLYFFLRFDGAFHIFNYATESYE
jgi:hypothetical protein